MKKYLPLIAIGLLIGSGAAFFAQAQSQVQSAAPAPAPVIASPSPAPDATPPAPVASTPAAAPAAPVSEPAQTYYNYAHDESEYSVKLPEAPSVKTIWKETPEIAMLIDNPMADSTALGEEAFFKRVDLDTEEVFDTKITFLKARRSFLQNLKQEDIEQRLRAYAKDKQLSSIEFTYAPGAQTLKWATLKGFTVDSHNHPAFCAIHYLTGLQSVTVVETVYSIENTTFQNYYNTLVNSITYSIP